MTRPRRSAWTWLRRAVLAGLALGAPMAAYVAIEASAPAGQWPLLLRIYAVCAALATSVTLSATVLALLLRAWSEWRSRRSGREAP